MTTHKMSPAVRQKHAHTEHFVYFIQNQENQRVRPVRFGKLAKVYDVTMRFDKQERDKYAITTDRGGHVGTIQRAGEKFAFIDARHLRPSGAELIPVYADELQQVVDKLKQLDAEE